MRELQQATSEYRAILKSPKPDYERLGYLYAEIKSLQYSGIDFERMAIRIIYALPKTQEQTTSPFHHGIGEIDESDFDMGICGQI